MQRISGPFHVDFKFLFESFNTPGNEVAPGSDVIKEKLYNRFRHHATPLNVILNFEFLILNEGDLKLIFDSCPPLFWRIRSVFKVLICVHLRLSVDQKGNSYTVKLRIQNSKFKISSLPGSGGYSGD